MEELLSFDCEEVKDENLSEEEVDKYLSVLDGWHLVDSASIERVFYFDSFSESMEFVNSVAGIAESENHHPDINIRFSSVSLTLSTHSADKLTLCDFIVAARINTLI